MQQGVRLLDALSAFRRASLSPHQQTVCVLKLRAHPATSFPLDSAQCLAVPADAPRAAAVRCAAALEQMAFGALLAICGATRRMPACRRYGGSRRQGLELISEICAARDDMTCDDVRNALARIGHVTLRLWLRARVHDCCELREVQLG